MTASHDDDDGSDSEVAHWPSASLLLQQPATIAPGYDIHNGLHSHTYLPSEHKTPSPEAPQAHPVPRVIYAQPYGQYVTYPTAQYAYAPPGPVAYPAPTYYTYTQPAPASQMTGYPVYSQVYQPAYSAPQPAPWLGRTKEQVEEDNMKIAAREGAYDRRKVQPVGVKDDQMMWVVETDGSHTLRAFVTIKEMKGEWKRDPRFEDSYYFVRKEEEKRD